MNLCELNKDFYTYSSEPDLTLELRIRKFIIAPAWAASQIWSKSSWQNGKHGKEYDFRLA